MKALIIDISSLLYRSFYKLMNMSNSQGQHTGALFGLVNTFLKLLKDKPDYVVCCLDVSRASLKRRELLESYKAHRDAAPDALAEQIEMLPKLIEAFGFYPLTKVGYEADDMIASSVEYFARKGIESFVVSSDKDLLQLVPKAKIILSSKDYKIIEKEEEVFEVLGTFPDRVTDLFALQGDTSDGIPGVKGIGAKTAAKLINEFDNIDNLLSNLENIPAKLAEKIEANLEILHISKKLATLNVIELEEIPKYEGHKESLLDILESLEFNSILKKLGLEKETKEEISYEEHENFVLTKDSTVLFIDKKYYVYGDKIIIADDIDLKDYKIDTYNAKDMYKLKEFNLGIDAQMGYHLLFPEDRVTLDKAIRRIFNQEVGNNLERIFFLHKLIEYLRDKIPAAYEALEKPIIKVLAYMEKIGVEIDIPYLQALEKELEHKIAELTKAIYEQAEEEFNIASPKQLSYILFEKLQLPVIKKTKTGYSTDVSVLNELKSFAIVESLLEYRQLVKILSTYVLPLQKSGHRIHTTYHQDGTATGRLSSSNPNLQNIPSKTFEGLKVRKAFISSKKYLLSVDYSQIELRILADLSEDELLREAYTKSLDLHLITAQKLFNKQEISREERLKAKIVNFSIIYGKSAFGLAKELNISLNEANVYIAKYFDQYKKVQQYIGDTIKLARKQGYVETMFGRRRELHDINNRNKMLRSAAERMAVNSIIQGTQAEIIKKAMILLSDFIKDKNINMVMQVHDELVFEIDDEKYVKDIINIMKNCVKLKVPIEVNSSLGSNWTN